MRRVGLLVVALLVTACSARPAADQRPVPPAATEGRPSTGATVPGISEVARRAAHTMTPLAGREVLVAGGCVVDGCTTATGSTYVVGPTGARRVGDLREPRDAHTATALQDGRVLVTGGFTGEGVPPLASAELYDPDAGTWDRVGGMAVGRGGHAAALLGDGRVLVAGGWVSSGTYTATTEIFDPATGEFGPGPDLPQAVDGLAATSLPDGRVLVTGGQVRPGVASDRAAVVAPDGTLTEVGPLRTARFKHALVTLGSGRVLAIGGTPDDQRLLTSTEVFDAGAGRFRRGPELHAGRYKLAGSTWPLGGDRVVVAGGGPGVEVLDVPAGRSRVVARLGEGRASFSTVGVVGERLLVLGGYDEEIRLVGEARSVALHSLSG